MTHSAMHNKQASLPSGGAKPNATQHVPMQPSSCSFTRPVESQRHEDLIDPSIRLDVLLAFYAIAFRLLLRESRPPVRLSVCPQLPQLPLQSPQMLLFRGGMFPGQPESRLRQTNNTNECYKYEQRLF